MYTRILAAVCTPCLLTAIVAPASASQIAGSSKATCTVADRGMGRVEQNQYVSVGAVIKNTSKTRTATKVRVTITYRNAKGKVLDYPVEYWMPDIPARTTAMFGHTTDSQEAAVNGARKVTVSAVCGSSKRSVTKPLTSKGRLVVDAFYGDYLKGTFTNTRSRTFPSSAVYYSVVRNKSGDIVGGGRSFIVSALAPGATAEWTSGSGVPGAHSGSATLFATDITG